jgi:hypothetical protein
MKISWVLSDSVQLDPMQNVDDLKRLGAFWGSWCTWRACATDNVICHEMSQASELIKRDFHRCCNFYIPNDIFVSLDRPPGVNLYEGKFVHDVIHQEEIVALHLAATTSDIVLLLGFDLAELCPDPDRLKTHQALHHRNLIRQAIKDYEQIQWVVVDHPEPLDPNLINLPNISTDNLQTILTFTYD